MSRFPLPATDPENHPDVCLFDPADIDVFFIGASGVQAARLMEPASSSLQGLNELDPEFVFTVGERDPRTAPPTSNEDSAFKIVGDTKRTYEARAEKSRQTTKNR